MVQPGGRAIGVDHITELNDQALRNVQHQSPDLLADGTVLFVTADGREGYPPEAPYDAIHVGAALQSSVQPLLDQLKPGGLLFVPEQVGGSQSVRVYERDATGKVHKQDLMGVSYIPLTDPDQQRRRYW